ncbi:hypothetical protein [Hwangdonia lutea]|uniref:Uncharacterized protein n=1 Tax=Hwangdonia lutea TaxID=3075823 RepID=A0AA97HRJ6_9FLAO|nr:hypothetical protein [Hwangdonia sp. SCSIO 19198]WOD44115.1 hypothetical protein RNZ46_02360 [Hwangdonia sp. SCSIO 19198]
MKQIITKSNKNAHILNQLILNGFYNGYIGPEKFELMRNRFPNNYRLIGTLNEDGNYDLRFGYKHPMNIAAKFLLAFGVFISLISLIKGNWMLPLALAVFGFIFFIGFKLQEKKEINLFTNKLLEFHKTEYI